VLSINEVVPKSALVATGDYNEFLTSLASLNLKTLSVWFL